jgi:hypothetical protein
MNLEVFGVKNDVIGLALNMNPDALSKFINDALLLNKAIEKERTLTAEVTELRFAIAAALSRQPLDEKYTKKWHLKCMSDAFYGLSSEKVREAVETARKWCDDPPIKWRELIHAGNVARNGPCPDDNDCAFCNPEGYEKSESQFNVRRHRMLVPTDSLDVIKDTVKKSLSDLDYEKTVKNPYPEGSIPAYVWQKEVGNKRWARKRPVIVNADHVTEALTVGDYKEIRSRQLANLERIQARLEWVRRQPYAT